MGSILRFPMFSLFSRKHQTSTKTAKLFGSDSPRSHNFLGTKTGAKTNMLFSVTYAKFLLFFCAHSLVLSNPISGELDAQNIPLDVTVTKGDPELSGVYENRSPEVNTDLHELSRRQATKDQTEALRLHNVARQSKNLRPLSWDATLTANALSWAKEIARKDTMVHSSSSQRPNQGENLAYAW